MRWDRSYFAGLQAPLAGCTFMAATGPSARPLDPCCRAPQSPLSCCSARGGRTPSGELLLSCARQIGQQAMCACVALWAAERLPFVMAAPAGAGRRAASDLHESWCHPPRCLMSDRRAPEACLTQGRADCERAANRCAAPPPSWSCTAACPVTPRCRIQPAWQKLSARPRLIWPPAFPHCNLDLLNGASQRGQMMQPGLRFALLSREYPCPSTPKPPAPAFKRPSSRFLVVRSPV